jgi:hypothetical protein
MCWCDVWTAPRWGQSNSTLKWVWVHCIIYTSMFQTVASIVPLSKYQIDWGRCLLAWRWLYSISLSWCVNHLSLINTRVFINLMMYCCMAVICSWPSFHWCSYHKMVSSALRYHSSLVIILGHIGRVCTKQRPEAYKLETQPGTKLRPIYVVLVL